MKSLTQEWIEKAEGDYRVATREAEIKDEPAYEAICFHSQQCIEKYAKAFLQEQSIEPKRTHDMEFLLAECAQVDEDFKKYLADFAMLDDYSVDARYPGGHASKEDAENAVECMKRARLFIRSKLNLPEEDSPKEGNEPEK